MNENNNYELVAFYEDHEEWMNIDTGEIESFYSRRPGYPYVASEYCNASIKKELYWTDVDSINKIHLYMDQLDKRTIIRINDVVKYHNHDCGVAERNGKKPYLSRHQAHLLERLVDKIIYRNVVYLSTESMCSFLNVSSKHIDRELKRLRGNIKIIPTKRGEWRVEINPVYGWVYTRHGLFLTRQACIDSWVRGVIKDTTDGSKTQIL